MPDQKKHVQTAIALGGSKDVQSVPKVVAQGQGDMAQKIIDWAEENGLAIEKDSDLAQVLINLNLGDSVPEEVFMAVAEILYYIFEVNKDLKDKMLSPTA